MRGQLLSDGSLGRLGGFEFVTAQTIIERLFRDGSNMLLTIGLSFRDPKTRDKWYDNVSAIRWLRDNTRNYSYEAWYDGGEELHVNAISDNDLL